MSGVKTEEMSTLIEVLHSIKDQLLQHGTSIGELRHFDGGQVSPFPPFDDKSELWSDYLGRFKIYLTAHGVTKSRHAPFFLSCQSQILYKDLSNLAKQNGLDVQKLTFEQITEYMNVQYEHSKFVIRERAKFWGNSGRAIGESIPQLVNRIRRDAATCAFDTVTNPLDDALRIRFINSLDNPSLVKALLQKKDDELTFEKAVRIASEMEEAERVAKEAAKENIHSDKVQKVSSLKKFNNLKTSKKLVKCYCCGETGHFKSECRYKKEECTYCGVMGHLEKRCYAKHKKVVKMIQSRTGVSELREEVIIGKHPVIFELDTGSPVNLIDELTWVQLGKPPLRETTSVYRSATHDILTILGNFRRRISHESTEDLLEFHVVKGQALRLLGRKGIVQLGISIDTRLQGVNLCTPVTNNDSALKEQCLALCDKYPELFKDELGCLKDYELEVKFKDTYKPIFCRPRPVPYALREDLETAYLAGIKKGVWKPVTFCEAGTPVVPIVKSISDKGKRKLRVCGDYSVAVNKQLETHRYPMPLPDDLMMKLSGGYYFSKVDLADAYNQVKLGPISQYRLALSTHKGVLLQLRLPFGITSAPGYFQEIMEKVVAGLNGVAVYLDDLLVSGKDSNDHVQNLAAVLERLAVLGLRCRQWKCEFAMSSVVYLGHILSATGIEKGPKVDALLKCPRPISVGELRSFLGGVQFYAKFLPTLWSTIADPLYKLTRKEVQWLWSDEVDSSFMKLKEFLASDSLLVHFDPNKLLGVSTDASEVGVGAVLFHRYPDGCERPISHVSKILNSCQRRYSQIHREALAIVYAFKKFHQFLFARHFILVTDHKPLLAMFGVGKAVPSMAGNRLARWALFLSQYNFNIEYRSSMAHGNADVLSRLPMGEDIDFDGEEDEADKWISVTTIKAINDSVNLDIVKVTARDPMLTLVMRFVREGWPDHLPEKDELKCFRRISEGLIISSGCLFYGCRLVIPKEIRSKVLEILHLSHFGETRMKQLARTTVYWPRMDRDIEITCSSCLECGEHRNLPNKVKNHPWVLPEKPWSRLHVDHAVKFMGHDWLIVVDAYSRYPCIHRVPSVGSQHTIEALMHEFAHFGYPHALVSDRSTTFTSDEFQNWCNARGIVSLCGAPYHPATNGLAERMVQSFKQAMRKSTENWRITLEEFLQVYRRTPMECGSSPSELLNGRQLRAKIDVLLPNQLQLRQKAQSTEKPVNEQRWKVGDLCYASIHQTGKKVSWTPGKVKEINGNRHIAVELEDGRIWIRHWNQLRRRDRKQETEEYSRQNPRRSHRNKPE